MTQSLFERPGNWRIVQDVHDAVYDTPLGGPADTLALLSLSGAVLCATPAVTHALPAAILSAVPDVLSQLDVVTSIASAAPALLAGALATLGAGWLAHVYAAPIRDRNLLRASMQFKSSPPPFVPHSVPGLAFGVTVDRGDTIYIDDESLTRHTLIVGQSGVGKTVAASYLMAQQIERGGGLLFIDPKVDYDNIQNIYNFAVSAGRQDDLLILCPGDPKNSNTYNPILFGDPDEVASRVLGLIPATESNAGADYYKQAANSAIRAVVGAFQYLKVPYTMADLSLLLDNVNAMEALYNAVLAKDAKAAPAIELRLWVENFRRPFDPKAQAGVGAIDMVKLKQLLGGIISRLQQFGTGTFGEVMNTYDPEVRLDRVIEQGKIVYVALPTMGKDVAAINFAKMMIADLRTCVSWLQKDASKRPKIPFQVFIDEAGRILGDGAAIAVLCEQARSARIFLQMAVQNLAQFKMVDESLAELVPGNTTTKMIFRLGSNDSPNELAELIGMRLKTLRSLSKTAAKSSSSEFTQLGAGHMESNSVNTAFGEREQEDFIISPDAIKRLDKGECILVYEGGQIFDLRIPMVSITKDASKAIGPFRVMHSQPSSLRGLFDLQRDIDKFTTNAPLTPRVGDAGAGSDANAAAAAKNRQVERNAKATTDRYDPGA